jgi:competence ComEA-like helix-hairpin-helix protein
MTMTTKLKTSSGCWELRSLELCLWTGLLALCCLWALPGHGRNTRSADVQVRDMGAGRERAAASAWRMDINTATEAELVTLPGIGPRRAQAIVRERLKRGAFNTVWELSEVQGLTKALVQRLEPMLRASAPPRSANSQN